jgi:hypothetical protein
MMISLEISYYAPLDIGLSSEGIATDKVSKGYNGPGRISWAIRPSIM